MPNTYINNLLSVTIYYKLYLYLYTETYILYITHGENISGNSVDVNIT